jgi:hypothetical protein
MVSVGNRQVCLDEEGLDLFNKYYWKINYTNYFLHRTELVPIPISSIESKVSARIVSFPRELLGIHGTSKKILFRNGNSLDYRLDNLVVARYGGFRYGASDHNMF